MCGRYALALVTDTMARLFEAAPDNDLPETPDFNICPTQPIVALRLGEGGRRLVAMRWGFVPHWYDSLTAGPLLINARSESIAEKPAFRAACRQRRCLVPASGFYEWHRHGGEKLPWFLQRRDRAPLVMAGVWQEWGPDRLATCALVTTEANALMAPIHHRMPLVLEPEDWPLWLGEAGHGAARLMRPADDAVLEGHRVDVEVNSNRAEGPQLIAPLAAPV